MSITDELREYANRFKNSHDAWSGIGDDLTAIADRVDAEHEKSMSRAGQLLDDAEKERDYNYANWQDCKQRVLQGNITFNELNARIECLEDELSHRIEPPKDADGVSWHRGDRVIDPKDPDGKVNTVWIAGDNTLITDDHLLIFPANELRHYHAPTVEDVLREFANEVYADADNEIRNRDFLCAKYAKRLTLAEGEDA